MPIHDWTRVSAGTFHHFHNAWMNEISNALNGGLLPKSFYALTEQFAGNVGPDVLTLHIRHESDDRIIALIEIVSEGNNSSGRRFRAFLDKATASLAQGFHLLLIDLQPPTVRDPQGIHGAVWSEIGDDSYQAPADKPLTLTAYSAGAPTRAYIEPVAVGDRLPDMPLFLVPGSYVYVPLEKTYETAFRGVPQKYRELLTASERGP